MRRKSASGPFVRFSVSWAAYPRILLRAPSPAIQSASQLNSIVAVHGQQVYRGTTGSSQSNNAKFIKLEVVAPNVSPRVVQFCNRSGLGINGRDVGAFLQVAPNAAQAKVARVVRPTVLSTDNVIDVMGQHRGELWQPAVFSRCPRTSSNERTDFSWDCHEVGSPTNPRLEA